jgi:hypothetical protein
VIGGIEARSFKDDPDRREDLAECALRAFRAPFERGIAEFLLPLESDSTIVALISVYWHRLPHNRKNLITQHCTIIARLVYDCKLEKDMSFVKTYLKITGLDVLQRESRCKTPPYNII